METSVEYLETVTTFATEGFAFVCHKSVDVHDGASAYRVARVTSATCSRSAVQLLANTFMRIADNCTFEFQAVDEMAEFAILCRGRANFSRAKVERAWRGLAVKVGYSQLCVRQQRRWDEHMMVMGINSRSMT